MDRDVVDAAALAERAHGAPAEGAQKGVVGLVDEGGVVVVLGVGGGGGQGGGQEGETEGDQDEPDRVAGGEGAAAAEHADLPAE